MANFETRTIADVKRDFVHQAEDGCFGIWEIFKDVKENLNVGGQPAVRRYVLEVVDHLLEQGFLAGESPYAAGDFVPWKGKTKEDVLNKIDFEWFGSDREPGISDAPWFGQLRKGQRK